MRKQKPQIYTTREASAQEKAKKIKSKFEDSGINVGERTVGRKLLDMAVGAHRITLKPKLTKAAKEKHLKGSI